MDENAFINLIGFVFLAAIALMLFMFAAMVVVPAGVIGGGIYLAYRYNRKKKSRLPSTQQLVASQTQAVPKTRIPTHAEFLEAHLTRFMDACGSEFPPNSVYDAFAEVAGTLYAVEDLYNPLPPLPPHTGAIEEGRYRDMLLDRARKTNDPDETLRLINSAFGETEANVMAALPGLARLSHDQFFDKQAERESSATIPLLDVVGDARKLVWNVMDTYFAQELVDRGLFSDLRHRLELNAHAMSGVEYPAPSRKIVLPTDHKGTPREVATGYLAGTPLLDIFLAPIPFSIPDQPYRMEHTLILGGSGAGKTTLIQDILLRDISRPDPPPTIIIDPKGELVKRVQRLALFHPEYGALRDRLIIVDPADTPALNMFHAADRWDRVYSDSFRRQLENQAIENFSYIFSSIESPLTQKQSVCFTFCIRLLFRRRAAGVPTNITTLASLLDDPAKNASQSAFAPDIERLDPVSRNFFGKDYYSTAFGETRAQIKARLYGIIMHPALTAMFSSKDRKLDLFDCLQTKKIVLVNANLDAPGSQAGQLFARYFVALTLNAAFERAAVKRTEWHPALLYVDEFQLVADELKTPEMLRLAREYNLGIVLAFQDMHGRPFNEALRAAISTNTSIKYASSPEGIDLAYAARDLRCDPEFIRAQTKSATHGKFACFVRGMLERPVSLSVPFGNIRPDMLMDDDALAVLRSRNRQRLTEVRANDADRSADNDDHTAEVAEPVRPADRRW